MDLRGGRWSCATAGASVLGEAVRQGTECHAPAAAVLCATHAASASTHGDTHSRHLILGVWLWGRSRPCCGLLGRSFRALPGDGAHDGTETSCYGAAPQRSCYSGWKWCGTGCEAQGGTLRGHCWELVLMVGPRYLGTGLPHTVSWWQSCCTRRVLPTTARHGLAHGAAQAVGRAVPPGMAGYPLLLAGDKGLEAGGDAEAELVDERWLVLAVDLHLHPRLERGLICGEGGSERGQEGLGGTGWGRVGWGSSPVSPQTGRYSSCCTFSISSSPLPAPPRSVVSTSRPGPPPLNV